MKRYACNLLYVSPGRTLRNAVVEVDADGIPMCYAPLHEELPFTQWLGGVMVLLPEGYTPSCVLSLEELPDVLISAYRDAGRNVPCRLWHIEGQPVGESRLSPSVRFRMLEG